jgi:hypothetical protein
MAQETRQDRQVDREHLEFVTRSAGKYQGLGESAAGLLLALYGAANLLSRQPPSFRLPLLFLILLLAMFVFPRLFQRFYYRRKFGYVKPLSPNPSWKVIWLSTGAFALFIFLMFVVSDYMRLHQPAFEFEPASLFLGTLFLLITIPTIWTWTTHQYKPYELLVEGFVLLAIAFLPVLHLQTKEQVSNGWLWVVFGTAAAISGLRAHRELVRNLTPSGSPEHHA